MKYPTLSMGEALTLNRVKFAGRVSLGANVLDTMELSRMEERITGQLIYKLEAEVLSRPLGQIVYSFPATPWDHWKEKWLPRLGRVGRWYLRRHPVRESAKAFSAAALYPHANVRTPDNFGPVRFMLQPELEA